MKLSDVSTSLLLTVRPTPVYSVLWTYIDLPLNKIRLFRQKKPVSANSIIPVTSNESIVQNSSQADNKHRSRTSLSRQLIAIAILICIIGNNVILVHGLPVVIGGDSAHGKGLDTSHSESHTDDHFVIDDPWWLVNSADLSSSVASVKDTHVHESPLPLDFLSTNVSLFDSDLESELDHGKEDVRGWWNCGAKTRFLIHLRAHPISLDDQRLPECSNSNSLHPKIVNKDSNQLRISAETGIPVTVNSVIPDAFAAYVVYSRSSSFASKHREL